MIECSYVKADCSSETHFEIKGLSLFVRVFENNLIENIKKGYGSVVFHVKGWDIWE